MGILNLVIRWEGREEEDHGESIIQVTNGINEGRVALFDEVIKRILGLLAHERVNNGSLSLPHGLFDLFLKDLEISHLGKDWLMENELNVFSVVVRAGSC
jgi:hypothetical protein